MMIPLANPLIFSWMGIKALNRMLMIIKLIMNALIEVMLVNKIFSMRDILRMFRCDIPIQKEHVVAFFSNIDVELS